MIIGKRSSIVFNGTSGQYVDGVWQESVKTVTVSDCSVQPFSQKDYSPSIRGEVPQKRVKVYCPVTSGLSVAEGNTFVWSGQKWSVESIAEYSNLLDYFKIVGVIC